MLARLLTALPKGGVLAVQMPDNTQEPALQLMEKVGADGPWADAIAQSNAARNDLMRPEGFYDLLRPLCSHLDIWHTHYNHIMPNHAGVVEWFKGSSLRPFYSVLEGAMREQYLAAYTDAIARAYSVRYDGKVILSNSRGCSFWRCASDGLLPAACSRDRGRWPLAARFTRTLLATGPVSPMLVT